MPLTLLLQNSCCVKWDQRGDAEIPLVCTFAPYDASVSCCFDRDRFQEFMVLQLDVDSPIDFVLDTSAHVSVFIVGRLIADNSQFSSINSILDPLTTVLHFRHHDSISLQAEFNRTWRSSRFLTVTRTDVSPYDFETVRMCCRKIIDVDNE